MKTIPLANCLDKSVLVDDDDWDALSLHKWWLNNKGYAFRNGPKKTVVLMHRQIAQTPKGFETDHANRNKLDNRKSNLRVCSKSENSHNRTHQKNNRFGLKGVSFSKDKNKFRALIAVNGVLKFLGYFSTAQEASAAYQTAASEMHGQFARI